MAEHPIMPLSVAYLLGDTLHFSNEEMGFYVRILCAMWLNGGILRERDLAKIGGISRYKFDKYFAKISEKLTIVDGTVSQKRLTDTLLKVKANRRKASEAGKVSWDPFRSKREHRPKQMLQPSERKAITREVSKSLSTASSQSVAAPQQGASEEASKGHPLQASPELVAKLQNDARRGYG